VTRAEVVEAFERLGWDVERDVATAADEVIGRLGVAERHERLVGRLLTLLVDWGAVTRRGKGFGPGTKPVEREHADEIWRRSLLACPAVLSELQLIGRCGAVLPDVLRGELDPLSLVFAADTDTAEHLYRHGPSVGWYNEMAGTVAESFARLVPQTRPLRVLELGAGTGGLTSWLLRALPDHGTEYVFTDVSQAFLKQATERFGSYPDIRFALLDIERDPVEQGFSAHSFDVVVASDIIHATRDLAASLANVKTLLVDGGLLWLVEATKRPAWFDLVFGLLPGWWAFSDVERRPDHALMDVAGWHGTLTAGGFSDVASVTEPVAGEPVHHVILARGPVVQVEPASSVEPSPTAWLLLADGDDDVGGKLAAALARVEPCRTLDDVRHALEQAPEDAGVVWVVPVGTDDVPRAVTDRCSTLLDLVKTAHAARRERALRFVVVTRFGQAVDGTERLDVTMAPLWGMVRCVASEFPNWKAELVDLPAIPTNGDVNACSNVLVRPTDETETAVRDERTFVRRLVRPYDRTARAIGIHAGDPGVGEVLVRYRALGLNFKDVARRTGMVAGDAFGLECAGVVEAVGPDVADLAPGDEVVGLARGTRGALALCRREFLFTKPHGVGFDEAATLAIVFFTAV